MFMKDDMVSSQQPDQASCGQDDPFAFYVAQVRADTTLLRHALESGDRDQAILLASRLHHSLGVVERIALGRAIAEVHRYDEIVSPAVHLRDEVEPLLDLAPWAPHHLISIRRYLARVGAACLSRYRVSGTVVASGETLEHLLLKYANLEAARLDGAVLRNVTAQDANLSGVFARRVTMHGVDLWGSRLDGARLDVCRADHCCFATTIMTSAVMTGATITGSDFRGAKLRDVDIERAAFIACDFRGAVLDVTSSNVSSVGAQFIRCDLRSTSWAGRDLAGVRLEDCKLSGLRGRPSAAGVIVLRPDLSTAGDGTRGASLTSAETLWSGSP